MKCNERKLLNYNKQKTNKLKQKNWLNREKQIGNNYTNLQEYIGLYIKNIVPQNKKDVFKLGI